MNISWNGAKLVTSGILAVFALLMWNLTPPEGLDVRTWHLFTIFVTTIVGVILKPLPMGAVAIVALAFCTGTETLTLAEAMSTFSSAIVWLVIFAFFIARGFINTGLGKRISYMFVAVLGNSTLGLAYGFVLSELLLAPIIPSNTARGAGVVFPILSSLAREFGSCPRDGTQRKVGSYLISVCFHANVISSAMFLTALAGNPLIASLAASAGVHISWLDWAWAAIVPGLVSLLVMPLILFVLYPPEVKETPEAPILARQKLQEMGGLKLDEVFMLLTFALLLVLWIFGKTLGVDATTAALFGVAILLFSGVIQWDDILAEKSAWGTLVWFAVLLMMAHFLTELGMINWFSGQMQSAVSGISWMMALGILMLVYFYTHYFFASITAHITSMYSAFLVVSIAAGAPPMLAAMLLAVMSSLSGGLTHYGTGTAPVYFGAGYIEIKDWWVLGAILGVVNIAIWVVIGGAWWKVIGIW